jgi:hypothetical protein
VSERGTDFLRTWIEKNVTTADRHGSPNRAMTLADRCIAEAATVGISASDLEQTWGTIESIIYEAMQSDVETMRKFWGTFARARDTDAPS